MKNILYIIALAITVTLASCSTETSFYDTLDADQTDQLFNGSRASIINEIGQAAYDTLTVSLKFPINTGNNPPVLDGNSRMWQIVEYEQSNDTFIGPFDAYTDFTLSGQDNNTLTINYTATFKGYGMDGIPFTPDDELDTLTEIGIGRSFVSGNESTGLFTVIVKTQVTASRIDVISLSGKLLPSGDIEDLNYAFVVFENGDPGTTENPGVVLGGIRQKDSDGTSTPF